MYVKETLIVLKILSPVNHNRKITEALISQMKIFQIELYMTHRVYISVVHFIK